MTTIAVIIILFIAGFLLPSRAKRMQKWIDSHFKRVERHAIKPPVVGRVLRWPFKSTRKAAIKSLKVGKKTRDKTPL
ncbi:MAG: DUF6411 family protein [Candidatus Saccharibacteria bacterium]